jgi:hypothetical protein
MKPPRFLADLYADLRDRRLLPLVALLVVAIAAVPFLLGGKSDEEEPAAVPPIEAAPPSSQADFSVVPAKRALREPRKRLGYREQRNPFDHTGRESTSSGSEAPEASPAESSETASSSEPAEAGSGEIASSSPEVHVTKTHITRKAELTVKAEVKGVGVNAKVGFLGHLEDQEKIRPMTKLPNAKHPVVVYVGPTQDDKGALFLMTSNVTAYYGKGRCAIAGQVCSLLELKPGNSATFAYGYGDSRYKVQVKKLVALIHKYEVKKHFSSDGNGE